MPTPPRAAPPAMPPLPQALGLPDAAFEQALVALLALLDTPALLEDAAGGRVLARGPAGPLPADGVATYRLPLEGGRHAALLHTPSPRAAPAGQAVRALLESRLAEQRLALLDARVRTAARSGGDWFFETNADGVLTWVSDNVVEHTGWPASAEIGVHSLALNRPPPAPWRAAWDRYRALRAEHRPFQDAIAERDGADGPMLITMSGEPFFAADGRFLGYRGTARKVETELRLRDAAHRAQDLLQHAIDAVQAGVMISGPDGRILTANEAWRRNTGKYLADPPATWPAYVRALVEAGAYPEAVGREEAFIDWRLRLAERPHEPQPVRYGRRNILVADHRLPDGTTVHLSFDVSDSLRQAAALAVSEARLRAVLSAQPDLWIVTDADGCYVMCSDDAHPWLVAPFDEMRGKPFSTALPPDVTARANLAIQRAHETQQVQRVEYELRVSDGVTRTFEARVTPVPDGGTLWVTRDMTDLRRLEHDMLVMRRALEADATVPIVVADALHPDLPIVYANPSFERLTGFPRAELIGRNCRFLNQGLPEQPGLATLRQAIAAGRACTVLLRNRRRDGSEFDNELHVAPVRDEQGRITEFIGVLHDATERIAAQRALADAEERWKFALEGAGDGVWDFDETSRQVYYSASWKRMLGYEEAEIGHSIREWSSRVHPDDWPAVRDAIEAYRRGETASYRTEHRLRHRDGHWIWVLDRGKIVHRDALGRPLRVVGTHSDITRIKLAEQAVRDKQAAELASRAKSEFLSRMSHEMRTPLNAVIGFTQLLRLQPSSGPAKVVEYADHVLRASEHLLSLVNEVLDLQRVEEGRVDLQPEPVELEPFVGAMIDLMQPVAQRHAVALTHQLPPGVWALADARALRQVLLNVISNAVKYNRSGGWVCVSLLEAEPGRVALAVEDTGQGMTAAQLARLFQPFERLGHEASGIEGTGLGLVIARSLCERMDGRLELSSVRNAGTLARVELPAAEPPPAPPPPPVQEAPPAAPEPAAETVAPLRLLYVEDNRINALLFEEAVRMIGGYEVQVAEDGASAIELAGRWTPDLLVLDAHLPDMDGYQVLAALRAMPAVAGVPAWMCSADAMPEDIRRALDAGFAGYWTKPITIATLADDLDAFRRNHTAPPTT